jgi:hypothetical protein
MRLRVQAGLFSTSPAPKAVIDAIQEIQVTSQAGQPSGFQMRLTVEKGGAIEREYLPDGFFTPARRILLVVETDGVEDVAIDGYIARHDLSQSNVPGAATLTITGRDVTQLMDQIDLTGVPLPGLPPVGQVGLILAKYLALGVIPMPIPTPLFEIKNRSRTGTCRKAPTTSTSPSWRARSATPSMSSRWGRAKAWPIGGRTCRASRPAAASSSIPRIRASRCSRR